MLFFTGPSCLTARLRLTFMFVVGGGSVWPWHATVHASDFQSGFMRQNGAEGAAAAALALANLDNDDSLAPGRYHVSILVNLNHFDERPLEFVLADGQQRLTPCLSRDLLEEIGVRLASLVAPVPAGDACIDLATLISGAGVSFDSRRLTLSLSIPQIALRRDVAGYVDPARWDSGINAAFVNYQVSAQQGSSQYGGNQNSDDLYLKGGFNLSGWRFRSSQSLRRNNQGQREWTRAYTYVQRDLPGTRANVTLGETFTSGEVFRSLPIKGMVIATDLEMLPDVLQGYAPVIRGVANSRAKLEVFNNGYPLYSTYVSAGPYEIDDLSLGGGSGELEVVLTEADGRIRRFTQPYSTLGNLMREGVWRYSASVGRYNATGDLETPLLMQGSLAIGTGWDFTLYGGLQASGFYRAGNLGVARDLGSLGALAIDVTRSTADLDAPNTASVSGLSYAIKYGKAFETDTTLRFAGYRYSTEGYRDFDESVRERRRDRSFRGSRRSRLEAAVFQNLGKTSSLSLTLSQEDFWNSNYQQRQFQVNFSHHYQGVSYTLFASQSLNDERSRNDRQFGLSVSFPLELGHSNFATLGYNNQNGQHSQTARLTGSTHDNRLGYSASLNRDQSQRQSTSMSASWQAPYASLGAGINQGSDYRSVSVNASGAMLLHSDGIELGPYLSDTSVLVEVPGVADVGISNAAGVRTNAKGFALVPYMRPYRINRVALKTDDLGPDVEIDNGVAQVVPRRGAVVKTTFAARSISRLILTLSTRQGHPLPFGAQVSDATRQVLGVVGQGGQVLLAIGEQPQALEVRWGQQHEQTCQIALNPGSMEQRQGYRLQALTCSP
ncbi:fimbria/pilus outer membrane usher protein [Pseudomonas viridiflava]|uniref:fimbria/pilus outer membrane usher protein n=1 Tax=Pseudomonas viridiflava TaxID=33069 RepID=UPI0004279404